MDPQDSATFPNAPWHLTGSACLSAWRVPARVLPPVPQGLDYLRLGDTALLITAWARYQPGGTLAYNELAVAVPVRGGGLLLPACTVTQIWVDDERAAQGGKKLWCLPKQRGAFEIESLEDERTFAARAAFDGQALASLRFEPAIAVPGRPSASGFVVQCNEAGPVRTRCRGRARLVQGRALWDFAPAGPLGFLHGRQPLFSVRLRDLEASFGV
ncbi:acetoacetate decarboxylase family protein [Stutzerimonas azotifigens]|uniref:acetoacetate decarboxylase family protein n=1 Tax=Stutzerimonas azotifigens TaxID=291995 RepID=UPI00042440E8|nr:acetoacetate decarboxylase family protein [Stutzerimonas azotifigens]